jgi:hypothetical protein
LMQRKLQIQNKQEKQKTQQTQTAIPFLSHAAIGAPP